MSYPRRDAIETLPGHIHAEPTSKRSSGAGATPRSTATDGFGATVPTFLVSAAGSNGPEEAS